MIRTPAAGGVVERDAEIPCGRAAQTLLDLVPRCQQVGQADAREIAGQRRAEHRAARAGRRDAGDDLDLDARSGCQLDEQSGHAVHTGVTRRDHRDRSALLRTLERRRTAVHLARHAGLDALLSLDEAIDEVEIQAIAGHAVACFERTHRAQRHLLLAARTDADTVNFHLPLPFPMCSRHAFMVSTSIFCFMPPRTSSTARFAASSASVSASPSATSAS